MKWVRSELTPYGAEMELTQGQHLSGVIACAIALKVLGRRHSLCLKACLWLSQAPAWILSLEEALSPVKHLAVYNR